MVNGKNIIDLYYETKETDPNADGLIIEIPQPDKEDLVVLICTLDEYQKINTMKEGNNGKNNNKKKKSPSKG